MSGNASEGFTVPQMEYSTPTTVLTGMQVGTTSQTPWQECQLSWQKTKDALGAGMEIHVYGFAVVYALTGVVSVARLHKLYTFRAGRLMSGFHFKMNMHISTLIFSLLRTVVLCLDPYGSRCRVLLLIIELLWSLAFPCLAVAFSLLLVVLMETTKLYPNLPCIIHRTWTLVASTALYTTVLVLKDVLHHFLITPAATTFNVLSLIIFGIWGLIMMLGYFFVARKIRNSLRTSGSPIESEALRRFSSLLLACGSVGLLTIMMQVFSAVSEYGLKAPPNAALASISPWAWWIVQSALRALESAMCCLLMLVASRTDNKRHVQVAPGTTWDWPRMHGWSLEAVPARPGRPIPADPKHNKNSPAIPTQSTITKPPDIETQDL
ncbi:proline-rich transmembrane protein 4-like [Patiria miniata]|uniref:Proline-rich transmembrane protein 3/4 domain-containing protein n=1 Tax=Patiria miniata TaxID=46514 RepID=A0A914AU44_PATMI|nr:proline-rich transmembrane protein 4-like [Patiria miniata]